MAARSAIKLILLLSVLAASIAGLVLVKGVTSPTVQPARSGNSAGRVPVREDSSLNVERLFREIANGNYLPTFVRYDYAPSPRDPFLDKSVTTTIMSAFKAGVFDKLVLLSWLNEDGKITVFVQNTETNDVQKITSEPNKDNFRIVEIHPNPDPKLFEVVISNGTEQAPVKFNQTPPKLNPQPGTTSAPAAQTKTPQAAKVTSPGS
jgi:hypothetical protein